MIQKYGSSLFVLSTVLLFFVVFSPSLAFAEVDTDKSVYTQGELVKISGTLDLQDDDEQINIVEIEITDSNNDTIVNAYTPVNDNEFSSSYDTITWTPGTYRVAIVYNDVEDSTEFEIVSLSENDDGSNDSDDTPGEESEENQQNSSSATLSDTVLDSPIDLKADVISSTQIDLSWSMPDENDSSIIGFKIEARTNTDPNYSVIVENTNNNDTAYSHTGLTPDTVYAYQVLAINSAGESEPSNSTTVKTSSNGISSQNRNLEETDIPTNLMAMVTSPTSIELRWDPPTQTYGQVIQGYTINQEIAPAVYNEIANTVGSSTNYTVSNLITDESYTFTVVANYLRGSSDVSETATATLSSSDDNTDDSENETETNETETNETETNETETNETETNETETNETETNETETNETETNETETNETETNETETNETETNETETNETETNETETNETETNETETNETLTTSSGAPNPPANLQATQISQNRINLSWSASTDSGELPLVGYKIESKTSDESDYTILVTNTGSPSITTYSHTGLTAGLTYDYRISAINSDGESNPSDVVTATIEVTGGSTGTSNEQEGGLSQQQPQTTDPLQPVQVTLSTDKPTYNPNDSITISGTTDSSSQTVPLGMRVVSPDGAIVYVRSISIDNNGSFEIIISSAQRQSSAWQSDGEFKVEVTQNGRIQATTTFANDGVGDSSSLSSDDATDPTNQQQQSPLPVPGVNPPGDESPTLSNDEFETIKTQNTALQSANQQLHDENNQLKLQIKDLNEKIEQLDIIIKEQVRVMLETLGIS